MTQTISPPNQPESEETPPQANPPSVPQGANDLSDQADANSEDLAERGEGNEDGRQPDVGERPPSGRRRRRRGGGGPRERREANEQGDSPQQSDAAAVPAAPVPLAGEGDDINPAAMASAPLTREP